MLILDSLELNNDDLQSLRHYRHSWTILNGQGDAKIDPYPYGR